MQTIARANRVAEGKENGLVIDYVGIVNTCARLLLIIQPKEEELVVQIRL